MGPLVDHDPNNRSAGALWSVPNPYGIVQWPDTYRGKEAMLDRVAPYMNCTLDSERIANLYPRTTNLGGAVKPVATIANLADADKRARRFESLYQVGSELMSMGRIIGATFSDSMGREMSQQDLDGIPMLDVFIGFPEYEGTLYFAGGIETYGCKGRATILDRGAYSVTWVNQEAMYSLVGQYGNLLIAPSVDGRAGAFTLEGVLDLRGLMGEDPRLLNYTLIDNSITAIVGVAPKESPAYLLPETNFDSGSYGYGDGSKSYSRSVFMGGRGGFGRMGESVAGSQRTQRAEAPKGIDAFAIYNFHPVVIDGLSDMEKLLPSHLG